MYIFTPREIDKQSYFPRYNALKKKRKNKLFNILNWFWILSSHLGLFIFLFSFRWKCNLFGGMGGDVLEFAKN